MSQKSAMTTDSFLVPKPERGGLAVACGRVLFPSLPGSFPGYIRTLSDDFRNPFSCRGPWGKILAAEPESEWLCCLPEQPASHIPPCLSEKTGCCLSPFSYCYAKIPQQRQLKGKGFYFGSLFKDIVHHVRESWWQEHEAASQVACAVSKQRVMNVGVSFLVSMLTKTPA